MLPHGVLSRVSSTLDARPARRLSVRAAAALVVTAAAIAMVALPSGSATAASLEMFGSFNQPVDLRSDPSDPDRIYVGERQGRIVMRYEGQNTTVLNFTSLTGSAYGPEDGLISFELAPDFATTGKFYVFYTTPPPSGSGFENFSRIAEFTMNMENHTVNANTHRILLDVAHPTDIHNGGQIHFGPDGYLYWTLGDGGHLNDPNHQGQNPATLLGTLMRINPSPSGGNPYTVPPDNPYFDEDSDIERPEIWAWGLRNPWRFSFDRETGDLAIGDVGQDAREELNWGWAPNAMRGNNFGWPCREGLIEAPGVDSHPYCGSLTWADSWTDPLFEMVHIGSGEVFPCAIIAGYVSHDSSTPDLEGRFVYGDWCQSQVRAMDVSPSGATNDGIVPGLSVVGDGGLVSFAEDGCGRLYTINRNSTIRRIVGESPADCEPVAPADTTPPTVTHVTVPAEPDGDNGWWRGDMSVQITADDGDAGSGVDWIQINTGDGNGFVSHPNGSTIALDFDDGEHVVSYRAFDLAGNLSDVGELMVKVDRTAPVSNSWITRLSGFNCPDQALNGFCPTTVHVSAVDNDDGSGVGTRYLDVYRPGEEPEMPGSPYTGPVMVNDLGQWMARFYTVDAAGNAEQVRYHQFRVDPIQATLSTPKIKRLGGKPVLAKVTCPSVALNGCDIAVPKKLKLSSLKLKGSAKVKKKARKQAKKQAKVNGPRSLSPGASATLRLKASSAQCKALKKAKAKFVLKLQVDVATGGGLPVSRKLNYRNVVCK